MGFVYPKKEKSENELSIKNLKYSKFLFMSIPSQFWTKLTCFFQIVFIVFYNIYVKPIYLL